MDGFDWPVLDDPELLKYIEKRRAEGASIEQIQQELDTRGKVSIQPRPFQKISFNLEGNTPNPPMVHPSKPLIDESGKFSPPNLPKKISFLSDFQDIVPTPPGSNLPGLPVDTKGEIIPPALQDPMERIKSAGDRIINQRTGPPEGMTWQEMLSQANYPMVPFKPAPVNLDELPMPTPAKSEISGITPLPKEEEKIPEETPKEVLPDTRVAQGKIDKMRLAGALAKNFDVMGRGLGAMAGHNLPQDFKPLNTEDLERQTAEEEDRLSPGERKMLSEAFGVEIPEETTYSRIRGVSSALADAVRFKEGMKAAREQRQFQASKLTDKDVGEITKLDQAIDMLQVIGHEKENFDTGPIASAWHGAWNWVGLADPKKAAFKAMVIHEFNQRLHDLTGAAVSPGEVARLMKEMPTLSDNDAQFEAKLKVVLDGLQSNKRIFLENKGKQGKNISEFQTGTPKEAITPSIPNAPGGSTFLRNKKTGKIGITTNPQAWLDTGEWEPK